MKSRTKRKQRNPSIVLSNPQSDPQSSSGEDWDSKEREWAINNTLYDGTSVPGTLKSRRSLKAQQNESCVIESRTNSGTSKANNPQSIHERGGISSHSRKSFRHFLNEANQQKILPKKSGEGNLESKEIHEILKSLTCGELSKYLRVLDSILNAGSQGSLHTETHT